MIDNKNTNKNFYITLNLKDACSFKSVMYMEIIKLKSWEQGWFCSVLIFILFLFFATLTKCLDETTKGRKHLLPLISNEIKSIMVARMIHTGSMLWRIRHHNSSEAGGKRRHKGRYCFQKPTAVSLDIVISSKFYNFPKQHKTASEVLKTSCVKYLIPNL